MSESDDLIQIDKMSIDQAAGAFVMIAGAIGSLLLVIWQSKCHCKVNLCYIFRCERRPPNEEELKTLANEAKELKNKTNKMNKKEDKILKKEEEILAPEVEVQSPRLVPKTSKEIAEEKEKEKIIDEKLKELI